MAANTISVLNPANWRPIVQDFLNNILVATDISNTQVRAELTDGSSVNFPQMSDLYVQDYVQGTDLTIEPLNATQSTLTVNKSKVVTMAIDPVQEKQAKADYAMKMAQQSAFRLANQIDKDLLGVGVSTASNTTALGSMSVSSVVSSLGDIYAALARRNATDGEMFGVVTPEFVSLLTQAFTANGFNLADKFLRNQFTGMAGEFKIYSSNNLPTTNTLVMSVIPVAGDTVTIYGVTFTYVASGTATNPGEISIGANAAAAQANTILAFGGTGTPGATTYIDVSADNRTLLSNQSVAATAASTSVVVTGVGKINASETITSPTDVWGTESASMLFGRVGAPSLGMQMMPNLYIAQEPKQLARNYMTHTLYGVQVFSRDAFRLQKVTINQ